MNLSADPVRVHLLVLMRRFLGTDPEGFIPVLPVVPHLQNWENPEVEADGRTD